MLTQSGALPPITGPSDDTLGICGVSRSRLRERAGCIAFAMIRHGFEVDDLHSTRDYEAWRDPGNSSECRYFLGRKTGMLRWGRHATKSPSVPSTAEMFLYHADMPSLLWDLNHPAPDGLTPDEIAADLHANVGNRFFLEAMPDDPYGKVGDEPDPECGLRAGHPVMLKSIEADRITVYQGTTMYFIRYQTG